MPSSPRATSSTAQVSPSVELASNGGHEGSDNGEAYKGKDKVRLLEKQEEETEKCGGYAWKPNVSSLTAASLGMNGVFFGMLLILSTSSSSEQPAAKPAVSGAELAMQAGTQCDRSVADMSRESCSGNGILFDDAESCLCFDCWTGSTCSTPLRGDKCVVQAGSGTPFLFEDYWLAHPEAALTIRASYHLGYTPFQISAETGDAEIRALPRLEKAVRELHAMVGNAELQARRHRCASAPRRARVLA